MIVENLDSKGWYLLIHTYSRGIFTKCMAMWEKQILVWATGVLKENWG